MTWQRLPYSGVFLYLTIKMMKHTFPMVYVFIYANFHSAISYKSVLTDR